MIYILDAILPDQSPTVKTVKTEPRFHTGIEWLWISTYPAW